MLGFMVTGLHMGRVDIYCDESPATASWRESTAQLGTVPEWCSSGLKIVNRQTLPSSGISWQSGDDVGDQVVLYEPNLVLEGELALLEPRDLQLVGRAGGIQRVDRRVEIAMFDPQYLMALAQFLFGYPGIDR